MRRKTTIIIVVIIALALVSVIVFEAYNAGAIPGTVANSPSPQGNNSPTPIEDGTVLGINPTSLQLTSSQIGETIQLDINITNVKDLWAWDLKDLSFNPKVLNLTQVTEGPFLAKGGQTLFIWTSTATMALAKGDIPEISTLLLLSKEGVSGSGKLATLSFNVIAPGTSQITFNQTTLLNPTEIQTGVHGIINVASTINGLVTVYP